MLRLRDIRKDYKMASGAVQALKGVSIDFRDSEFVAVLGPSGCGKTTLLNIVGGLDSYNSGELSIDGVNTSSFRSKDWDAYRNHRVGFVFQSYNLIGHQSVLANVELACKLSGVPRAQRRQRAKQALEQVGLGDQLKKKPNMLSGGQMQRVAIARALVNGPSIILADEPTGALDSQTSVQIMEILKQLAQERLVIMVTHNPDLARDYASRIIRLKDGEVVDDSNPLSAEELAKPQSGDKPHGTRLGFFTALGLSFSNLLTKKGRTILTSFAGAIGITGIAIILAMSNGVNRYIEDVEGDTMSSYPIELEKESFNVGALMSEMGMGDAGDSDGASISDTAAAIKESLNPTLDHELDAVYSYPSISESVDTSTEWLISNDLGSFKTYYDEHEDAISYALSAVEFQYSITPLVYRVDTPVGSTDANAQMAVTVSPRLNFPTSESMASGEYDLSYFGYTEWSKLPEAQFLRERDYELLAGDWPTEANEIVLALNSDNELSDSTLYSLGLMPLSRLEASIDAANRKLAIDDSLMRVDYNEVLGVNYVAFARGELYQKEFDAWANMSDDQTFMLDKINSGEGFELEVVGIIRVKKDASGSSGMHYTQALELELMERNAESGVVKAQLADPKTNALTGKAFPVVDKDAAGLESKGLPSRGEGLLGEGPEEGDGPEEGEGEGNPESGDTKPSREALIAMINSMDMKQVLNAMGYSDEYLEGYVDGMSSREILDLIGFDMEEFMSEDFAEYLIEHGVEEDSTLGTILNGAYELMYAKAMLELQAELGLDNLYEQVYEQVYAQIMEEFGGELDMDALYEQFMGETGIEDFLSGDLSSDLSAAQLSLLKAQMSDSAESYEDVLEQLEYTNADEPSGIVLYPRDFSAKDEVVDFIAEYNAQAAENEQVSYTDLVSLMIDSVTSIVDTISYVLIAFVAISLLVSSIMIAIITYISVLERRREIGVLRAIGASKRDISRIFNAETLIEGLLSGLFGVLGCVFICIPINLLVINYLEVEASAVLPAGAGLILIAISVGLNLIAGFIPSQIAARKDPVVALRSE